MDNTEEIVETEKTEESKNNSDKDKVIYDFTSKNIDISKLDKDSRKILEETDESDYTFRLKDFEGPLDLLVHLIKVAKIDIRSIFISNITEQYMEMMKEIDTIDFEKASEFISMAATLLEIKSNHLLPKESDDYDSEAEDMEENFYKMVEEYKLIQEEMGKLEKIENVNSFYKEPDDTVGDFRYELPEKLSVDALIAAFSELLQKVEMRAETLDEKKIQKDKFSVSQKLAQIKDMLIEKNEFMFSSLFEEEITKSEVVNTFLALLELLKRQYIKVVQNSLFEDIKIIRNDDESERLTDDTVSEYDKEEKD